MKKVLIIAAVILLGAGAWMVFTKSGREAVVILKTGGKGPGGCDSETSCQTYCTSTQNLKECFDWQKEHGYIKEEDIKKIAEVQEQLRASLATASPVVRACLESRLGTETIAKLEADVLEIRPGLYIDFAECFGHK